MVVEVVAHSVTATQVVVHAPAMSLLEGEIITERGYPCWNPPCRRTVVTLAINGVDFLGRPEPLAFYFYHEPWRFLYLLWKELQIVLFVLSVASLINAVLTWHWRFFVYERYLGLKYRFMNRCVFPLLYKSDDVRLRA